MQLTSIASGSSGNCIYIGTERTHVLIDAGISGKRIENGLQALDLTAQDIEGILITHEHCDHIAGLGVMARRHGLPIYATYKTIDAILGISSLGRIDPALFCPIEPEVDFAIGDMQIHPVRVSHDAADPVAYLVRQGEKTAGVITDLGVYDDSLVEKLRDADVLLLEANHDIKMLEVGPYPYPLKQRILGEKGHLSNSACGQLLSQILHDSFRTVMLGHLSKENNYPELAFQTVSVEVDMGDCPYSAKDFPIRVAPRDRLSETIRF